MKSAPSTAVVADGADNKDLVLAKQKLAIDVKLPQLDQNSTLYFNITFQPLTNLVSLKIFGLKAKFSDPEAMLLATALPNMTALAGLNLGINDIGDKGLKAISEHLPECKQLTTLELRDNTFGPEGVKDLAQGINGHPHLLNLDVSNNNVAWGVKYLAASFAQKTSNVVAVDLTEARINDAVIPYLYQLIAHGNLSQLYLYRNKLTDEFSQLAPAIQASELRVLDLVDNKFSLSIQTTLRAAFYAQNRYADAEFFVGDKYSRSEERVLLWQRNAKQITLDHNWMRASLAVAFVRANHTSKLKYSFLALVQTIIALASDTSLTKLDENEVITVSRLAGEYLLSSDADMQNSLLSAAFALRDAGAELADLEFRYEVRKILGREDAARLFATHERMLGRPYDRDCTIQTEPEPNWQQLGKQFNRLLAKYDRNAFEFSKNLADTEVEHYKQRSYELFLAEEKQLREVRYSLLSIEQYCELLCQNYVYGFGLKSPEKVLTEAIQAGRKNAPKTAAIVAANLTALNHGLRSSPLHCNAAVVRDRSTTVAKPVPTNFKHTP